MASLYKKPGSPFWYLRYLCPARGWRHKSLKLRHKVGTETQRARQIEAEETAKERRQSGISPVWSSWVPAWLDSRYTSPLTHSRASACWTAVESWLLEQKLSQPALITREAAFQYLAWRRKRRHHNTALLELKFFAQILDEAVRRGYIPANPAARLGIKRVPPKEKRPLTDEEIMRLIEAVRAEDDRLAAKGRRRWMWRCFNIALFQGCRLKETQVAMSDVHLEQSVIVFRGKGGNVFGAPLHPAIAPMLAEIKAAGERWAVELPNNPAKPFWNLFRALGINQSFHSLRVTVITRLAIAQVDLRLAKRYVGHANTAIHAIYTKLRPEHAQGVTSALDFPAPASDKSA